MKTSRMINGKWMSLRDFAKKYSVDVRKLNDFAQDGSLPCKKMGAYGAWYVDMDKWNKILEIREEHDEVCTSRVTGNEFGMHKTRASRAKDNPEQNEDESDSDEK